MNFNIPYGGTEPPKVEDIWGVVPLSRPEMVSRVRENIFRQRVRPRVCVVETGAAVGACQAAGFEPDALLSAEGLVGVVRNEALSYLKKNHPDSYWVAFDDDDYYGAEYVAEHAGLAQRERLVGKSTHWVLFEGRFLALFRPWGASREGAVCNGGTMGAFVSDSPEFSMRECGEDSDFSVAFRDSGGTILLSSPYHTTYCRRNDGREGHTFPCTHVEFYRAMGGRFLAFSPNRLDLVDGKSPVIGGREFCFPRYPGEDFTL